MSVRSKHGRGGRERAANTAPAYKCKLPQHPVPTDELVVFDPVAV